MVSVGKEYRRTLFSAQYVNNGFTNGEVVCVVTDGFRCGRYDGTIQEVDLAEDLMVDGETYECVKRSCYLGDTLDGDGGADLAATARIRRLFRTLPLDVSRERGASASHVEETSGRAALE